MSLLGKIPSDWGPKFEGSGSAATRTLTGPNQISLITPTHLALVMFTPQSGRQVALNSDRRSTAFVPAGSVEIVPAQSDLFARWTTDKENLLVALEPVRLKHLAGIEFDADDFELTPPRMGFVDKRALTLSALLRDELLRGSDANDDCIESLITVFGTHLLRHYSSLKIKRSRHSTGGLTPFQMNRIHEFLEAHIGTKISVERLSEFAGMSPSHFTRAFKTSTGLPPHKFIISLRLARARTLIAENDSSLEEVARMCGFHSHSHLTSTMQRFWATSPSTFRSRVVC